MLETALLLQIVNLSHMPFGGPLGDTAPLKVGVAVAKTPGKWLRGVLWLDGSVGMGEHQRCSSHKLHQETLELHRSDGSREGDG